MLPSERDQESQLANFHTVVNAFEFWPLSDKELCNLAPTNKDPKLEGLIIQILSNSKQFIRLQEKLKALQPLSQHGEVQEKSESVFALQCSKDCIPSEVHSCHSLDVPPKKEKPTAKKTNDILTRMGSSAALSFLFSFLRKIWRSGNDDDLSSDFFSQCIESLEILEPGCLSDPSILTPTWANILFKTEEFLVTTLMNPDSFSTPTSDLANCLTLYCQLSLQKIDLRNFLKLIQIILALIKNPKTSKMNVCLSGVLTKLKDILLENVDVADHFSWFELLNHLSVESSIEELPLDTFLTYLCTILHAGAVQHTPMLKKGSPREVIFPELGYSCDGLVNHFGFGTSVQLPWCKFSSIHLSWQGPIVLMDDGSVQLHSYGGRITKFVLPSNNGRQPPIKSVSISPDNKIWLLSFDNEIFEFLHDHSSNDDCDELQTEQVVFDKSTNPSICLRHVIPGSFENLVVSDCGALYRLGEDGGVEKICVPAVDSVTSNSRFSCAVTRSGFVYFWSCCGDDDPTLISEIPPVKSSLIFQDWLAVLTEDDQILVWPPGSNFSTFNPIPLEVPQGSNILDDSDPLMSDTDTCRNKFVSIQRGGVYLVAVSAKGDIYRIWWNENDGELDGVCMTSPESMRFTLEGSISHLRQPNAPRTVRYDQFALTANRDSVILYPVVNTELTSPKGLPAVLTPCPEAYTILLDLIKSLSSSAQDQPEGSIDDKMSPSPSLQSIIWRTSCVSILHLQLRATSRYHLCMGSVDSVQIFDAILNLVDNGNPELSSCAKSCLYDCWPALVPQPLTRLDRISRILSRGVNVEKPHFKEFICIELLLTTLSQSFEQVELWSKSPVCFQTAYDIAVTLWLRELTNIRSRQVPSFHSDMLTHPHSDIRADFVVSFLRCMMQCAESDHYLDLIHLLKNWTLDLQLLLETLTSSNSGKRLHHFHLLSGSSLLRIAEFLVETILFIAKSTHKKYDVFKNGLNWSALFKLSQTMRRFNTGQDTSTTFDTESLAMASSIDIAASSSGFSSAMSTTSTVESTATLVPNNRGDWFDDNDGSSTPNILTDESATDVTLPCDVSSSASPLFSLEGVLSTCLTTHLCGKLRLLHDKRVNPVWDSNLLQKLWSQPESVLRLAKPSVRSRSARYGNGDTAVSDGPIDEKRDVSKKSSSSSTLLLRQATGGVCTASTSSPLVPLESDISDSEDISTQPVVCLSDSSISPRVVDPVEQTEEMPSWIPSWVTIDHPLYRVIRAVKTLADDKFSGGKKAPAFTISELQPVLKPLIFDFVKKHQLCPGLEYDRLASPIVANISSLRKHCVWSYQLEDLDAATKPKALWTKVRDHFSSKSTSKSQDFVSSLRKRKLDMISDLCQICASSPPNQIRRLIKAIREEAKWNTSRSAVESELLSLLDSRSFGEVCLLPILSLPPKIRPQRVVSFAASRVKTMLRCADQKQFIETPNLLLAWLTLAKQSLPCLLANSFLPLSLVLSRLCYRKDLWNTLEVRDLSEHGVSCVISTAARFDSHDSKTSTSKQDDHDFLNSTIVSVGRDDDKSGQQHDFSSPLRVGDLVTRGATWSWGDQDGGPNSVGRVLSICQSTGWVKVSWLQSKTINNYRMKSGCQDLVALPECVDEGEFLQSKLDLTKISPTTVERSAAEHALYRLCDCTIREIYATIATSNETAKAFRSPILAHLQNLFAFYRMGSSESWINRHCLATDWLLPVTLLARQGMLPGTSAWLDILYPLVSHHVQNLESMKLSINAIKLIECLVTQDLLDDSARQGLYSKLLDLLEETFVSLDPSIHRAGQANHVILTSSLSTAKMCHLLDLLRCPKFQPAWLVDRLTQSLLRSGKSEDSLSHGAIPSLTALILLGWTYTRPYYGAAVESSNEYWPNGRFLKTDTSNLLLGAYRLDSKSTDADRMALCKQVLNDDSQFTCSTLLRHIISVALKTNSVSTTETTSIAWMRSQVENVLLSNIVLAMTQGCTDEAYLRDIAELLTSDSHQKMIFEKLATSPSLTTQIAQFPVSELVALSLTAIQMDPVLLNQKQASENPFSASSSPVGKAAAVKQRIGSSTPQKRKIQTATRRKSQRKAPKVPHPLLTLPAVQRVLDMGFQKAKVLATVKRMMESRQHASEAHSILDSIREVQREFGGDIFSSNAPGISSDPISTTPNYPTTTEIVSHLLDNEAAPDDDAGAVTNDYDLDLNDSSEGDDSSDEHRHVFSSNDDENGMAVSEEDEEGILFSSSNSLSLISVNSQNNAVASRGDVSRSVPRIAHPRRYPSSSSSSSSDQTEYTSSSSSSSSLYMYSGTAGRENEPDRRARAMRQRNEDLAAISSTTLTTANVNNERFLEYSSDDDDDSATTQDDEDGEETTRRAAVPQNARILATRRLLLAARSGQDAILRNRAARSLASSNQPSNHTAAMDEPESEGEVRNDAVVHGSLIASLTASSGVCQVLLDDRGHAAATDSSNASSPVGTTPVFPSGHRHRRRHPHTPSWTASVDPNTNTAHLNIELKTSLCFIRKMAFSLCDSNSPRQVSVQAGTSWSQMTTLFSFVCHHWSVESKPGLIAADSLERRQSHLILWRRPLPLPSDSSIGLVRFVRLVFESHTGTVQIRSLRLKPVRSEIFKLPLPSSATVVRNQATGATPADRQVDSQNVTPIPGCNISTSVVSGKIYVWGLNDKDQLGGLEFTKIRSPSHNRLLSSLEVAGICCGSKCSFVWTHDGKVYAFGDASNGRLGLGTLSSPTSVKPVMLDGPLSQHKVVKVTIHSGGKHALALTAEGYVFSWGDSEHGKLGHGDSSPSVVATPKRIETLAEIGAVKDIAVGSSYSAAVTSQGGRLFTWGLGEYGRLGHGNTASQSTPKLVEFFGPDTPIAQIACGSRDAQTLALTDSGLVYSWGDGDFGKLGRGGSTTCHQPNKVPDLKDIVKVACGAQFSLAIDSKGQVFTWGKGDYYRLGSGSEEHLRQPTLCTGALKDLKVVDVAVGALHCLAITECGKVVAWGDNDHGQQGNGQLTPNRIPTLISGAWPSEYRVIGAACGSSHSMILATYTESSQPDSLHDDAALSINHHNALPEPSLFIVTQGDPLGESCLHWAKQFRHPCPLATSTSWNTLVGSNRSGGEHSFGLNDSYSELNHGDGSGNKDSEAVTNTVLDQRIATTFLSSSKLCLQVLLTWSLRHALLLGIASMKSKKTPSATNEEGGDSSNSDLLASRTAENLFSLAKLSSRLPTVTQSLLYNTIREKASLDQTLQTRLIQLSLSQFDLCPEIGTSSKVRTLASSMPSDLVKVVESSHPYLEGKSTSGRVSFANHDDSITRIAVAFDARSATIKRKDFVTLMDDHGSIHSFSGSVSSGWESIVLRGHTISWRFVSSAPSATTALTPEEDWGFRFVAWPLRDGSKFSDKSTLLRPRSDVARSLIGSMPLGQASVSASLAPALLRCVALNLPPPDRVWAAALLTQISDVGRFITDPRRFITLLEKQHDYEVDLISAQRIFSHSLFYRCLLLMFASLDSLQSIASNSCLAHKNQPVWLRECVTLLRTLQSLRTRTISPLPSLFVTRVLDQEEDWSTVTVTYPPSVSEQSLEDRLKGPNTSRFDSLLHRPAADESDDDDGGSSASDNEDVFEFLSTGWSLAKDRQLVSCIRHYPHLWGCSGRVWAWGHNHRGQLAGIDGSKIKQPVYTSLLEGQNIVSMVGGEQCSFALTASGQVFVCGLSQDNRLGLGRAISTPVNLPTQLKFSASIKIVQLAASPGGRHALALTACGQVYSWGCSAEGQLGHYDPDAFPPNGQIPRKIEFFEKNGFIVTKIAAGGGYSAAITSTGKLYMWGKSTNGRLGLGNERASASPIANFVPTPQLVETLANQKVIDVACGIGDAHTLALTDVPRTVWSWGDGDFGKLGRNNSASCSRPMSVYGLIGQDVVRVYCGSQFSAALTASGAVFTWGKGDYYRLGHGTEQHVKAPKLVSGLRGINVVSLGVGSLHCLALSDSGKIYGWGDNDEAQLGDGTTDSAPRPQFLSALSPETVTGVACGSAHSFAWRQPKHSYPSERAIPPQYSLLKSTQPSQLKRRLNLLRTLTDLTLSYLPALTLQELDGQALLVNASASPAVHESAIMKRRLPSVLTGCPYDFVVDGSLMKDLLLPSMLESFLRRSLQATMLRDRQHGGLVCLDRLNSRNEIDQRQAIQASVTYQLATKLEKELPKSTTSETLRLSHRVWKVKFVGEAVDDCGGGYTESIADVCEELTSRRIPVLIQNPDFAHHASSATASNTTPSDVQTDEPLLLAPRSSIESILTSHEASTLLRFVGQVMGGAMRSGNPLDLHLSATVWKLLSLGSISRSDLADIHSSVFDFLQWLSSTSESEFDELDLSESLPDLTGARISVLPTSGDDGDDDLKELNFKNRDVFVKRAYSFKQSEMCTTARDVISGLVRVVPCPILGVMSHEQLESWVCASAEVNIEVLKSVSVYLDVSSNAPIVSWLWRALEEMTARERSLFLRFVWGRSRLPRNAADFRGRDFIVQVMDRFDPPDEYLPESATCFFQIKLPRYSCFSILKSKLLLAIHYCRTIDMDEYSVSQTNLSTTTTVLSSTTNRGTSSANTARSNTTNTQITSLDYMS